jgi:hypothetical protein
MKKTDVNLPLKGMDFLKKLLDSFLFQLALLFSASAVVFRINKTALFHAYDGTYAWQLTKYNGEWSRVFAGTELNPLTGVGDIKYAMNFWCSLPTVISHLVSGAVPDAVLIYTLTGLQFFSSVWFLSATLRFNRCVTVLASWSATIFCLPFFVPEMKGFFGFYSLSGSSPAMLEFLSLLAFITALTFRLSGTAPKQNLVNAGLITALVYWLVFEFPTQFALAVPLLTVCAVYALLTLCKERAQVKSALICGAALSGLLFLPAVFVVGMVLWSPPAFFSEELMNTGTGQDAWKFVSMVAHGPLGLGWANTIVYGLACIGALSNFRNSEKRQRNLAKILIGFMGVILLFGFVVSFLFPAYKGILAQYFEWPLWPLMFLFSSTAAERFFEWVLVTFAPPESDKKSLSKRAVPDKPILAVTARRGPFYVTAGVPCFFLGCVVLFNDPKHAFDYPKPPARTPLVAKIEEKLAIKPGETWKGAAANFCAIRTPGEGLEWHSQLFYDYNFWPSTGNDHRGAGLWWYNIPTLFCYHQCMSPSTYFLTTRLFATDMDRQTRNVVVMSEPDPKLLAMVGVRLFLTDTPANLNGRAGLVGSFAWQPVSNQKTSVPVYLYEINSPNLNGFSPTEIIVRANAWETIKAMKIDEFEPSRQAVVRHSIDKPLVPVQESSLKWNSGGVLEVRAKSQGWSLLVLPLGYSRCLELTNQHGGPLEDNSPTILRVNAGLTGVLFENRLEANVKQRYGPFVNPFGRFSDRIDFAEFLKKDSQPSRKDGAVM